MVIARGPAPRAAPSASNGGQMTKTIPMRTELAHRTSDGIDVYLFWNEPTNRVTVGVLDA
jgi:hypothetical protein